LVTVAHHPSAANYRYWPEMYTDVPIVAPMPARPYGDTPTPRRFGTVSPLDPALFSTVEQYADEAVSEAPSGRYSPLDVARWLDGLAEAAESALGRWTASAGGTGARGDAEARRWQVDIAIQTALGRFFAGKMRAGTAYALYERTGSRAVLEEGLAVYRQARAAYEAAAEAGAAIYLDDLTFGPDHWLRGTWRDRLVAIDEDVSAMAALAGGPAADGGGRGPATESRGPASLTELETARGGSPLTHTPPGAFRRGEAVILRVESGGAPGPLPAGARLHYRHVNQAERYEVAEMERDGDGFRGTIPAQYTDSPYPLEYFFVVRGVDGAAWLSPGFTPDLGNRPYYLIRQLLRQDVRDGP